MTFEAVDRRRRCVRDTESGIEIWLSPLPEYSKSVHIRMQDGKEYRFGIQLIAKYPDKPFSGSSSSYPMILILMGELLSLANQFNGSFEERTSFIWKTLAGLSSINKIWPLTNSPFFYSDRSTYDGCEGLFPFQLPSENEIEAL